MAKGFEQILAACGIRPRPGVAALDQLGVAADTALFVDDQAAYCAGAAAMGMTAMQIARETPLPASAAGIAVIRPDGHSRPRIAAARRRVASLVPVLGTGYRAAGSAWPCHASGGAGPLAG
jgi:beta-phosphoglucomutase-like phosphatase (HAD superfamily)